MKIYKGYELMQAVSEGKLSLQQRVNSIAQYYNNCTIEFVLKDSAINIMHLDFEVIEENKEIEELEISESNTEIIDDFVIKNREKINELVRAVNKINKEREEK